MSKKIAIVSSASKLGGTELSALRICNLLRKKGHEVVYISPGSILQDEMPGIKFIFYRLSRKNPISLVNALLTLAKIVKKENIDILHCQDAMSCVLCCYAKKYLGMKTRLIWHERGIHYKSYITMSKKYSCFVDVIICNSYYERTLLMMNQCDPSKIRVIYNAIEEQIPTKTVPEIRQELALSMDDYVIGSVGRHTWDKGFNTLISAVALAKKSIPNLKLLLVGNGPNHEELIELTYKYNIQDCVVFTGFRRDIPNMLAAMDVFSIPSWFEAFGNVTVEAMLARRPVIASRVGGIPEVIQNGINGWLVPSADIDALVEAIVNVYNNKVKNEIIVEQAYKDACERYNFEKYYNLICDVYFGE